MKINGILTINKTLKPRFWEENRLNSDIARQLLLVADDFFQDLGLEGVVLEGRWPTIIGLDYLILICI